MQGKSLIDCYQRSSGNILPRFWSKVEKTDGCWNWNAAKTRGYGYFGLIKGKNIYAHRLSYLIHNGNLPDDRLVCHHCDNPSCVNPKHLFLGTHKDNLEDMRNKGREARGNKHGSRTHPERFLGGTNLKVKMTPEKVLELRELYASGKYSQYELGRRFGVHRRYVWLIVHKKTWKNL